MDCKSLDSRDLELKVLIPDLELAEIETVVLYTYINIKNNSLNLSQLEIWDRDFLIPNPYCQGTCNPQYMILTIQSLSGHRANPISSAADHNLHQTP